MSIGHVSDASRPSAGDQRKSDSLNKSTSTPEAAVTGYATAFTRHKMSSCDKLPLSNV